MQIIDTARAFIAAHPDWFAYLLIAIVSIALRVAGSKWWASYKERHPALAGTIEVARGIGFDAPKILQGLLRIAQSLLPPEPAAGISALVRKLLLRFVALASAALAVVALALPGSCSSLPSAQTVQRDVGTAVVSTAGAARIVAEVCADVAIATARMGDKPKGEAIAKACDDAYVKTRAELVTAGYAVDAWVDGTAGAPACAMLDVKNALLSQIDGARAFGAKIPNTVDFATSFMAQVAANQLGTCVRTDGGIDG